MWETWVQSLDWEDPLVKGKATHSSILAWKIPWTLGSKRVGQDWATFTFTNINDRIFLIAQLVKNLPAEKETATYSSILAWKSPWTEEPGGLQSMGLHDWECVHEGGGRWVGGNKLVELKKKKKRICLQFRRCGFDSWVGKILWRRKWQPTPVFLSGESHEQRSLAGYWPWDRKSQTQHSD